MGETEPPNWTIELERALGSETLALQVVLTSIERGGPVLGAGALAAPELFLDGVEEGIPLTFLPSPLVALADTICSLASAALRALARAGARRESAPSISDAGQPTVRRAALGIAVQLRTLCAAVSVLAETVPAAQADALPAHDSGDRWQKVREHLEACAGDHLLKAVSSLEAAAKAAPGSEPLHSTWLSDS